jgi:flagellar basal body-associated protein FliL
VSDPKDEKKGNDGKTAAEKPKAKGGVLALVLPAVIAGAAAFGGAKIAGAHAGTARAEPAPKPEIHPPGPTMQLEPFLVTVNDQGRKPHPMKVTLAVEFETHTKEEVTKGFTPRIRDACLTYLRTLTYEDAADAAHMDKLRTELVEKLHAAGVFPVERVLVTDFVVQ